MGADYLDVALVHEVYHAPGSLERLGQRLAEARDRGAELAVLPELPLHRWVPATRVLGEGDAEPPGGPLHRALARAAREAGIGIVGGAIVRDPATGRRHNRALVFDAHGELVAAYDKLHVPAEEGYWELDHYQPGAAPPRRFDAFGLPLGIQICSDLNRPAGSQLLGAQGAAAILAPRATPPASYERWRTVIRAAAITSALYVVSVNRPAAERGTPIGGPSIAVAPNGDVLVETTEPLATLTLERSVVEEARAGYPGYLAVRAGLYADAWDEVRRSSGS